MADREISIRIVGDASKAQTAMKETGDAAVTMEGKITGLSGGLSNFGSVMSGVLAAGAVQQVGGFLKDAAQAAADDAASTARLQTAVENSGVSWDSYSQQIDDAIKKGQELAFSDDDTRAALTALTQETGSTEEAMKRLHTAQDLARGTGMSLEQAAKLLGKTSDENVNTLKKYGIAVEEGATAQDLMNEVDQRFGGQAAAFAQSGAGQWAILQDQLGEIQEQIGYFLLPVMTLLATTLSSVATIVANDLIPAFATAVSAVGTFVAPVADLVQNYLGPLLAGIAAIATVIVASFVPAAVAWVAAMIPVVAEHIALAAAAVVAYAPIIAGLAAIGIAVALLYAAWSSNFLGIQDITKAVFDFIGPYITATLDAIQAAFDTVWPYIQAATELAFNAVSTIVTTYIGAAQAIVETTLPIIQAVFDAVWPVIQALTEVVFGAIADAIGVYIGAAQATVEAVLPVIQSVFETVWPIVQAAVEVAMAGVVAAVDLIHGASDTIGSVLGTIQSAFETVWPAVQVAVETAMTGITTAVDGIHAIYDTISGVLDSIKQYFTDAWDTIKTTVSNGVDDVITTIGTISSRAISALGDLSSTLLQAGKDLIQGFIDGVTSMLPSLDGVLGGITSHIPDIKGPPEVDRRLLYDSGVMIMEGFNRGLLDGYKDVQNTLETITSNIPTQAYYPHESADKFLYCDGTTAVFEQHRETNHPTCIANPNAVGTSHVSSTASAAGSSSSGYGSGGVAFSHVTSSFYNPRTGLMQFGGIPAGTGMMGDIWLFGQKVGVLLGAEHRRQAHELRDPAGCM